MFEKIPRIVCFPEPGSMWTPSHVSQARSCGLDCTRQTAGLFVPVANKFAPPRRFPVTLRAMSFTEAVIRSYFIDLSAWPRWLVVLVGTFVLALLIWIGMKL